MSVRFNRVAESLKNRKVQAGIAIVAALLIGAIAYSWNESRVKPPPSIFDNAVDDVLSFLIEEDFSRMPLEQRLSFLQGLSQRFGKFDQSESVVASSFMAGLTGPASEKLMNNARILGKDIFVQGASQYLSLKTEQERNAFLDEWIVKWVRFGDELTGQTARTDEQIFNQIKRDARRDLERGIEIDADMAQRVADFWERDIESVSTPIEQSQIMQFGPALRKRMIDRMNAGK